MAEELRLNELPNSDLIIIQPCSIHDRDSVYHGFVRFSQLLQQHSSANCDNNLSSYQGSTTADY